MVGRLLRRRRSPRPLTVLVLLLRMDSVVGMGFRDALLARYVLRPFRIYDMREV